MLNEVVKKPIGQRPTVARIDIFIQSAQEIGFSKCDIEEVEEARHLNKFRFYLRGKLPFSRESFEFM